MVPRYPALFVHPGQRELGEFLLFAFISSVDVAIAVFVSALIEHLDEIQQRNIRLLLESSAQPVPCWSMSAGTIKLVNTSTEKLFGYSRMELVGRNVETLVPERNASEHRKLFR